MHEEAYINCQASSSSQDLQLILKIGLGVPQLIQGVLLRQGRSLVQHPIPSALQELKWTVPCLREQVRLAGFSCSEMSLAAASLKPNN